MRNKVNQWILSMINKINKNPLIDYTNSTAMRVGGGYDMDDEVKDKEYMMLFKLLGVKYKIKYPLGG
jgi:hypothetical protein